MQGRTTAAQPVLSQRVERQPVSRAGYFADLLALRLGRIIRQEWTPVDAKCDAAKKNAFEAVKHEHRVSNQPVFIKEEDSVIAANVKGSTGPRCQGQRGTLLSFRRPK